MDAMVPSIERNDAVFLDFDGTLVDISAVPERVVVAQGLSELLKRVSTRLGGALAIVSGRPLAELSHLLYPFEGPAAGIHGLERRAATGAIIRPEPDASIERARSLLQDFAAATPGVTLEDKGLALALHFRGMPKQASACLRAARNAASPSGHRLAVMQGKMVVELCPREATKARALLGFLAESPFQGRRPVFVGDDRTDEDGFAVVNRLGGISIQVGSRGTTSAPFRFSDVSAVIAWLSDFVSSPPSAGRQLNAAS